MLLRVSIPSAPIRILTNVTTRFRAIAPAKSLTKFPYIRDLDFKLEPLRFRFEPKLRFRFEPKLRFETWAFEANRIFLPTRALALTLALALALALALT